jgi:hypothetical protein
MNKPPPGLWKKLLGSRGQVKLGPIRIFGYRLFRPRPPGKSHHAIAPDPGRLDPNAPVVQAAIERWREHLKDRSAQETGP